MEVGRAEQLSLTAFWLALGLTAAYLHTRGLRSWTGTRAAAILVLGFIGVLFTYFVVNLWVSGLHSYVGVWRPLDSTTA